MGNAVRKMLDKVWGTREMRVCVLRAYNMNWGSQGHGISLCCAWQVVMLGLDAAGKTTILYVHPLSLEPSWVPTGVMFCLCTC